MDIKRTDIFNRSDLIGDQSISTINNFSDYLESLLNPFNNELTQMLIELESVKITKLNTYPINIVNKLQIENNTILNSLTIINEAPNITTNCNAYINALNVNKALLTTIFNSKAQITTLLVRPTLRTVLPTNKSAVNKVFVYQEALKYSLPLPTPNTRLYVNREGTDLMWV